MFPFLKEKMIKYKYNRYLRLIIILVFVFVLLAGVVPVRAEVGAPLSGEKIGVVVTILPLADFVEQVGKDKVEEVTVMVPSGASPHTYEPTPLQLKKISRAQLYIKVGSGIDFELAWMDKISGVNKDMLICDSSQGIKLIGRDPHIWLSPGNAKIMVKNIYQTLTEIDPPSREYFERNAREFIRNLDELDEEIKVKLNGIKNKKFLSYHPSWSYFAKEYNLTQIAIEKEGKEPSAAFLVSIIEQARAYDISIILVSPQFNTKSAEVIAQEIGARIIIADPLSRDYLKNLKKLAGEMVGDK